MKTPDLEPEASLFGGNTRAHSPARALSIYRSVRYTQKVHESSLYSLMDVRIANPPGRHTQLPARTGQAAAAPQRPGAPAAALAGHRL